MLEPILNAFSNTSWTLGVLTYFIIGLLLSRSSGGVAARVCAKNSWRNQLALSISVTKHAHIWPFHFRANVY